MLLKLGSKYLIINTIERLKYKIKLYKLKTVIFSSVKT